MAKHMLKQKPRNIIHLVINFIVDKWLLSFLKSKKAGNFQCFSKSYVKTESWKQCMQKYFNFSRTKTFLWARLTFCASDLKRDNKVKQVQLLKIVSFWLRCRQVDGKNKEEKISQQYFSIQAVVIFWILFHFSISVLQYDKG